MMSKETAEHIRRMTTGERLQMTLEMIEWNLPAMFYGSKELVDRRFELLRRQNDDRNKHMLEKLARSMADETSK